MDYVWSILLPFGTIFNKQKDAITDASVALSPGRQRRLSSGSGEEAKIFSTVSPKVAICFLKNSNIIWQYLELKDLLVFSTSSRFCANMFISQELISLNMQRNEKKLTEIGNFKLSFASELPLGIFRRLLNRIVNGRKAIVSIDVDTGRVKMDIGSAFKETEETTIAAEIEQNPHNDIKLPSIDSTLEAYSIDEYDDFNPKHPIFSNPRSRSAITSYFSSSDFEEFAKENLEKSHRLSDLESWSLNQTSFSSFGSAGSLSRVKSKGGLLSTSTSGSLSPTRPSSVSTPIRERTQAVDYLMNDDAKGNDADDSGMGESNGEDDAAGESNLVASTFEYIISPDSRGTK